MSKVLTPQKTPTPSRVCTTAATKNLCDSLASSATTSARTSSDKLNIGVSDFDDITSNSSILEFLSKEQECLTDADPESIFQEVSRLADSSDLRTVDELLLEAERLIQQQVRLGGGGDIAVNGMGDNNCIDLARAVQQFAQNKLHSPKRTSKQTQALQQQQQCHQQAPLTHSNNIKMNTRYTRRIENCNPQAKNCVPRTNMADTTTTASQENKHRGRCPAIQDTLQTPQTPTMEHGGNLSFHVFVENLPSDSVISEESTPCDLQNYTTNERGADAATVELHDNTDDDEDTMEEITEGNEMLELPTTITTKLTKATTPLTTTTTSETLAESSLRINAHKVMCNNSSSTTTTMAATAWTSSTSMMTTTTSTPPAPLLSGGGGVARVGTKCDYNTTTQTQQHALPATTTTTASPVRRQPFSENFGMTNSVNLRRNSISSNNDASGLQCSSSTNNNNNNIALNARRGSMTTSNINAGCLGSNLAYSETLPCTYNSYKQKQQLQQHQQQQQPQPQYHKQQQQHLEYAINATEPIRPMAMFSDKSVGSTPKQLVSTLSSPIEQIAVAESITRQHALKQEIEVLQEKLKDTEERLESVRIQHETMSQMQRALRETNSRLQEESEMLKLDVQHLNECANILRTELQAARHDRNDALELQKALRAELEESQQERKRAHEQKDKDAKVIQDLQRQCREMERILVRKHPDSVSALIVASNSTGMSSLNDQENVSSRKLLEQRIAQLESDAKEQDRKAQQILANVQARFNTVQAKYETHIADLETQVLSLQEINTKLNAQIESQVRTLDHMMQKRCERYYNNCTQTDNIAPSMNTTGTQTTNSNSSLLINVADNDEDRLNVKTANKKAPAMRDHSTNTIGCTTASVCQQQQQHQHHHHSHQQHHHHQHSTASSSTSSTANSTPNNSRPNSKQSGMRRLAGGSAVGTGNSNFSVLHVSKLPVSQSESTLSLIAAQSGTSNASHTLAKEDSQLLASVRNMRVDLAIKNKAMQRLTRELDDCKKTIRKLQRERDANVYIKSEQKAHSTNAGSPNPNSHNSITAGSNSLRRHDGVGGVSGSSNYNNQSQYHYPDHVPASTENQVLREAQNKCRLLEADYKTLHEKRLQDLKTLQSAHERELASCNETVRVLQQRLNERGDDTQKRRKMPVDYYALKAKVSLLERRHSEREERLHMLVEALSKGRLNGALEDLLQENNNK